MITQEQAKNRSQRPTLAVDAAPHGRDEMNLAEFPISVLADRAPRGTKTLIFRSGRGRLTVSGSDAFGLPTAPDADVIVALIQLTKLRTNFTSPKVHFTRYELLRLLGWKNEGRSYRRLNESLQRWGGVTLHYDNCWWDNRAKKYGDATLHILESVVVLEGRGRGHEDEKQERLPFSHFTWNKTFLESCQADNLKFLDVDVYFSLEHAASKRLYRFLDKRFWREPEWVFDLAEIAFERVGLSRNYAGNVAKIREKLQPAIDELETISFLEPMSKDRRYQKNGKNWEIRLSQSKRRIVSTPLATADERELDPSPLVTQLVSRGVTKVVAEELARKNSAEAIEAKLEVFDWLVGKQDKKVAKSPAGYLVKSIQDGYSVPKGFLSKAERSQREEVQRDADRKLAENRRRARREEQRRDEEFQAADAYLEQLTPAERTKLEAEVLAQADPETRETYEDPDARMFRDTVMLSMLREHLARKGKLAAAKA